MKWTTSLLDRRLLAFPKRYFLVLKMGGLAERATTIDKRHLTVDLFTSQIMWEIYS